MGALLYFGLKFLAYTLWCYFGLFKFRHELQPAWPRAVAYGFLRLLMGLFFGVLIWLLSTTLLTWLGYGFSQYVFTYLLVYDHVRWFEWTSMDLVNISD